MQQHASWLVQHRLRGLMALLWLVVVLASSARACWVLPAVPSHAHHDMAGADIDHGDHGAGATTACHKFCAEEGHSLAKTWAADTAHFAPVLWWALHPAWQSAARPLPWRRSSAKRAQGPPVRTQLQRLAL